MAAVCLLISGGCSSAGKAVNRVIQLPFKATESGLRQIDRFLRQPGETFEDALEIGSKAAKTVGNSQGHPVPPDDFIGPIQLAQVAETETS